MIRKVVKMSGDNWDSQVASVALGRCLWCHCRQDRAGAVRSCLGGGRGAGFWWGN